MTRLVAALRALGLEAQVSLAGRWAELPAEGCTVYVVETAAGDGYYTWCDDPRERVVEFHRDATEAKPSTHRPSARRASRRCSEMAALHSEGPTPAAPGPGGTGATTTGRTPAAAASTRCWWSR